MSYNSKIILCKGIKIDREYVNVLSYTEQQMLNLCNSSGIKIAEANDYTFIDRNKSIRCAFSYSDCVQANYIAFQNPDYSNKWFFAFIDNVTFKGNNNTEISFTIDAWSTWFDYWTKKPCYVLRQHVNDDIVGKYTFPENIEKGEYIIDEVTKISELDSMSYIIQVTEWTTEGSSKPLATNFGGVYSAGGAYICEDIEDVVNILQAFANRSKSDAVFGVYMCPSALILNTSQSLQYSGQNTPSNITKIIDKPTSLNGYIPVNKKLLTFPYVGLLVSNNNGSSNTYYYELFNEVDEYPNKCLFNIKGVPTVGGSIKCVPFNYKSIDESYNEEEGIIGGKYPTLSWSEDAYTNWLTQNSVNIATGFASDALQIISGLGLMATGAGAPAGASMIASTTLNIANKIGQIYQHSLTPNSAKGNTNGGDINSSSDCNNFFFYKMCIKEEYARIVDNFFSRYGYAINKILSPNITGRTNWNYIEIDSSDCIGYGDVPSTFMNTINNACRKGVTIWHNHANVGNYSLNNEII